MSEGNQVEKAENALPLPDDAMHLTGHKDSIGKIVVLPGGERIATGCYDSTIRIFSLTSGDCIQSFQVDRNDVWDVKVIDADTIVSVHAHMNVRVWRVSDGKLLHEKRIGESATCCAYLEGKRLLVGGYCGGLYELEWDGSKLTSHRNVSNAHIDCIVSMSIHGTLIATASFDNTAKLWDATTLKCLQSLKGHGDYVNCVAIDCEFVVTGSGDKTLRVYDSNTFQFLHSINAHKAWISEVCIVDGENAVLSAAEDEHIALHALPFGECLWRMRVDIQIFSFAVLHDGRVAAGGDRPYDVRVFSLPMNDEDDARHVAQDGHLPTAFARALEDPKSLDELFLRTHIRADRVQTVPDLVAGHNLILMSIRVGVLTRENIHTFGGSSWHLKDNLYLPATKISTDDPQPIHTVFHHAESLGIISGGYALKIAQEIRSDVKTGATAFIQAIEVLSERVTALENRTANLEGNVEQMHAALADIHNNQQTLQRGILNLSRSLTDLQKAIRSQDKRMKYASIARCLLSFIPLVGNAIGNAAYTTTEVLMNLSAEHLVPAGVDAAKAVVTGMAHVDLSNFQVAQYAFSENTLSQLDASAREAVMRAISESDFQSLENIQSNLREHISSVGSSKSCAAFLDIGSASWLTHGGETSRASSSSDPHDLDRKAREYFQFLTKSAGCQTLSFVKALSQLDYLLRVSEGLSEVSLERLEELFFEMTDEDEEDVDEELFVTIFQKVWEEQKRKKMRQELLLECTARFQKHARPDGCLPLRFAARVLRNLCKEMTRRGFVEEGSCLEINDAMGKLKENVCEGNDGESVSEDEFMTTVRSLIE